MPRKIKNSYDVIDHGDGDDGDILYFVEMPFHDSDLKFREWTYNLPPDDPEPDDVWDLFEGLSFVWRDGCWQDAQQLLDDHIVQLRETVHEYDILTCLEDFGDIQQLAAEFEVVRQARDKLLAVVKLVRA